MEDKKRGKFGSFFGTVAVVGGSTVGLGNIWRFPYLAGENGGAAFILIYIIVSVLVSLPVMLSEFAIGRSARANAVRAIKKVVPGSLWFLLGYWGILTSVIIIIFYSVIAGWGLEFLWASMADQFSSLDAQGVRDHFAAVSSNGTTSVAWAMVYILLTASIVALGIEKGIERANKAMIPVLILILVGLVVYSFTLDGFAQGFKFLFYPDLSQVTVNTILDAVGQSFFSLSLGMATMTTYASYIKKKENLLTISGSVAFTDLSVALLSGMVIFPAVFTFGIAPTSGPELIFVTLPNIFAHIPGGYFIAILFFFLVFMAAITSTISLFETFIAFVIEEFKLPRKKAVIYATLIVMALSSVCGLSMDPDSSIRIMGQNVFDFANHLSANIMMPIGGLVLVLFGGWIMPEQILRQELTNGGNCNTKTFGIIRFLMRYFSPSVLLILFLRIMGVI